MGNGERHALLRSAVPMSLPSMTSLSGTSASLFSDDSPIPLLFHTNNDSDSCYTDVQNAKRNSDEEKQ